MRLSRRLRPQVSGDNLDRWRTLTGAEITASGISAGHDFPEEEPWLCLNSGAAELLILSQLWNSQFIIWLVIPQFCLNRWTVYHMDFWIQKCKSFFPFFFVRGKNSCICRLLLYEDKSLPFPPELREQQGPPSRYGAMLSPRGCLVKCSESPNALVIGFIASFFSYQKKKSCLVLLDANCC